MKLGMRLEGKVVIVTGAASGIGRGIARCMAEEGADVVIADINLEGAKQVAEDVRAFGRKALALEADVTQRAKAEQVVKSALDTFSKIDILVNNVGGGRAALEDQPIPEQPIMTPDVTDEAWQDGFEVNLKSQVLMCQYVIPHMRAQKSGKIINIASIAGKLGSGGGMGPYSAMKGAIITFTRALAREVGRDDINVNCICPGFVYTPSWQRGLERMRLTVPVYQGLKDSREVQMAIVDAMTLMGKEQTPEDIGRTAVFLASEDARNITGQSINVDAGTVLF